eukprot:UN28935
MNDDSVKPNVVTYSTLISAYGRAKNILFAQKAWREFQKSKLKSNTIIYNSIIGACAANKKYDETFHYFDDMIRNKLSPTTITMNSLLNACAKRKKAEKCEELFAEMKQINLVPTRVTYGTLIDCFARCGWEERAFEIAEEMKKDFYHDRYIYNLLLFACQTSNNYEKSIEIYNKMKESKTKITNATLSTLLTTIMNNQTLSNDDKHIYMQRFY